MNETIQNNATVISRTLSRKWKVDADDIRQEVLLWCIVQGIDGSFEDIEDEEESKALARRAFASMRWAGERYCRKEKAAREGYSVEDEAFYGIKALQELLVNYYTDGITAHAPIGTADSVRHQKSDGSTSGNYLVSLLDIDRGLEMVPSHYRQRLALRYGPLAHLSDDGIAGLSQSEIHDLTGWHHDRLALVLGSTGDKVRHRTETALRALQAALGGPSPWRQTEARAA